MKEFTLTEYQRVWNFLDENRFKKKAPSPKIIPNPTSLDVTDALSNDESCGRFYINREKESATVSVYKGTRLEEVMDGSEWNDSFASEPKPRAFDGLGYLLY